MLTGNLNSKGYILTIYLIKGSACHKLKHTIGKIFEIIHNYLSHHIQADVGWDSLTSRRSYFPSAPIRYEFVTP